MIELLIILLVISFIFKFFPPKNINSWYGYRTPRSKRNMENWKVANKYAPNFMLGMITVLFLLHFVFPFLGYSPEKIIPKLLIGGFVLLIIFTERQLK